MPTPDDRLVRHLRELSRTELTLLAQVHDWPGLAQAEIRRRADKLLHSFNYELVDAISRGRLDVEQVIAELLRQDDADSGNERV